MITELVILSPLILFYRWGIINLYHIILILLILYWLPKSIFVNFLNYFCPSVFTHKPNTQKKIAMTFDDVPYGSHEGIVRLLDRFKMKASFFIISDYLGSGAMDLMREYNVDYMSETGKLIKETLILQRMDKLSEMVQKGHQICNHGKSNSMHALKTTTGLAHEIDTCDQYIQKIYELAKTPLPKKKFYRPGCGLFTPITTKYCQENDYCLTLGSVYPNDPIFCIPYLNFLYIKWHIQSGDVVILHDRPWTPQMLRYLLPWLEKEGYKCVTLDELFI